MADGDEKNKSEGGIKKDREFVQKAITEFLHAVDPVGHRFGKYSDKKKKKNKKKDKNENKEEDKNENSDKDEDDPAAQGGSKLNEDKNKDISVGDDPKPKPRKIFPILTPVKPIGPRSSYKTIKKYEDAMNFDSYGGEQLDDFGIPYRLPGMSKTFMSAMRGYQRRYQRMQERKRKAEERRNKKNKGKGKKNVTGVVTGKDKENAIVEEVRDNIMFARGVEYCGFSEMVKVIDADLTGIVNFLGFGLKVGAFLLGRGFDVRVGNTIKRLYMLPSVRAGYSLLGRVVDALGNPIDGKGDIKDFEWVLMEQEAVGIVKRQPVNKPLETGVKFVDSMVPIGCGQRELIIGDPKTGKTAVAVDTILNQKGKDTICIYVAVGQRQMLVAKMYRDLRALGCMDYTIIVLAAAAEAASMQFFAPYSGCALGEYFMNRGRRVLIIYDDLSKHAVAYRQLALLLRRPVGREGYPGDIFYTHSRLLERAACLKDINIDGTIIEGGSLTALPVIETVNGDISAYIPTNVISITDGQIYLEAELFNKGIRPAISSGNSVSRVGSVAQNKLLKGLASTLKLELAQYREVAEVASLGVPLDEATSVILQKGSRLQQLMMQSNNNPVTMETLLVVLLGGIKGMFAGLNTSILNLFEGKIASFINEKILIFPVFNKLMRAVPPIGLMCIVINGMMALLADKGSILD